MSGNEDEGSAHSLHDGDKVDRYVIEGRLGAGGMGEVYRAFDLKLVRRVALKRLREGPMRDEARAEFTARMIREARALAGFDHPNVVTVFDVGASDGLPFIAMELVYVGEPSVSVARKIRWMMDVARGLAAAHRAGARSSRRQA